MNTNYGNRIQEVYFPIKKRGFVLTNPRFLI